MIFPLYSHGIPIVFPWISYRQYLVAELPWILGQEEEQVVVMLGIPAVGIPWDTMSF